MLIAAAWLAAVGVAEAVVYLFRYRSAVGTHAERAAAATWWSVRSVERARRRR